MVVDPKWSFFRVTGFCLRKISCFWSKSPKIELGRVTEAPTRQIQPADRSRGMGLNLAGRGLSERPQRDLGGNFRWPTRPGRPAERRSEALIGTEVKFGLWASFSISSFGATKKKKIAKNSKN